MTYSPINKIQEQLSWQAYKITQIENLLWTWGIVTQVKSELGEEYVKIVEYTTNQVNQM